MKVLQVKVTRRENGTRSKAANGRALDPPAYGLDVLDRASGLPPSPACQTDSVIQFARLKVKPGRQDQRVTVLDSMSRPNSIRPTYSELTFDEDATDNVKVVSDKKYYKAAKVGVKRKKTEWISEDNVVGIPAKTGGGNFRIAVGVYKGASADFIAHVFMGIEDKDDQNAPKGDLSWKGFYPEQDLLADNAQQLHQRYANRRVNGIVRADVNKAESYKARFKQDAFENLQKRDTLANYIHLHRGDDYIYEDTGCIGFARKALTEAHIDVDQFGLRDPQRQPLATALTMYGNVEQGLFAHSNNWPRLTKNQDQMRFKWDGNSKQLLVDHANVDVNHERGSIRRERILRVRALQRDHHRHVTELRFDLAGRKPKGFVEEGTPSRPLNPYVDLVNLKVV